MCLAYNSVAMEDLGKPVVMLVNKGFQHDAKSGGSIKGLPGLRVVITDIPAGTHDETEIIRKGVPLDKIIDALTRPLTEEEKSPRARKKLRGGLSSEAIWMRSTVSFTGEGGLAVCRWYLPLRKKLRKCCRVLI